MDKEFFRDEKIWRWLASAWTIVYFVFLFADFFHMNKYDFLVVPLSFLYIGILSIYVGTKEFDRWYDRHTASRHPGEIFVAIWTAIVFFFFVYSLWTGNEFRLAHEAVAVYIAVLSIFAVTQRSKVLHREARRRKGEEGGTNSSVQIDQ